MGDIQHQAEVAGLFDGSLSSCQGELQELMRQIDIMVNNKRLEWEASMKSTEAQLRGREVELTTMKMSLDVKTAETNRLTHELAGMESAQKDLVSQYEQQAGQLRTQLMELRKQYEKLERHHSKQNESVGAVKEEMEGKLRTARVDLRMAQNKIEDQEAQRHEWDQQRRALKHQVEGLEVQRQKLVERGHSLQQESASHKHQVGRLQQLLDKSDLDFKTRIVHIEGQLQRAQDTLDSKNSAIERLEALLDEAAQLKRAADDENRALLEDVGKKEHRIHMLESEVSSLQKELETKEGAFILVQEELKQEAAKFEGIISSRDTALRSSEDESRMRSMQASEETSRLRAQLQESQHRIGELVESEARLKVEVTRLENRLDTVQGENAALNVELTRRIDEMRTLDYQARQLRSSEKQKSEASEGVEHRLSTELSGMRREIESLTGALAQRNVIVESLASQLADAQRHVTQEAEQRDRLKSELKIANAELAALRVENHSLRSSQVPTQPFAHKNALSLSSRNRMNGSIPAGNGMNGTIPGVADTLHYGQRNSQSPSRFGSSLEYGPENTTPDPRFNQSPNRTRPSLEKARKGAQGSPGRPGLGPIAGPGSNSQERRPLNARTSGEIIATAQPLTASLARNIPGKVERWKENPIDDDLDSEGLQSLETGSLDSSLPSPPAFNSFLGGGPGGMEEGEGSSLDITGLSELGLATNQSTLNRPPSRESVGTRFLREDREHQAELERILNAHVQDLERRTTHALAQHSQKLTYTSTLST